MMTKTAVFHLDTMTMAACTWCALFLALSLSLSLPALRSDLCNCERRNRIIREWFDIARARIHEFTRIHSESTNDSATTSQINKSTESLWWYSPLLFMSNWIMDKFMCCQPPGPANTSIPQCSTCAMCIYLYILMETEADIVRSTNTSRLGCCAPTTLGDSATWITILFFSPPRIHIVSHYSPLRNNKRKLYMKW